MHGVDEEDELRLSIEDMVSSVCTWYFQVGLSSSQVKVHTWCSGSKDGKSPAYM